MIDTVTSIDMALPFFIGLQSVKCGCIKVSGFEQVIVFEKIQHAIFQQSFSKTPAGYFLFYFRNIFYSGNRVAFSSCSAHDFIF
jgi:hypothetical protein